MKRLASLAIAGAMIVACGGSAIVIGDDTAPSPAATEALIDPDAAPFDASVDDAPPIKVPPPDAGGDANADVECPALSPPAPTFCDGGPFAAKYDGSGCVTGYLCAPADCVAAGGQCVGLTPTACPSNNFGDVAKYSCGGGVGVACCLP